MLSRRRGDVARAAGLGAVLAAVVGVTGCSGSPAGPVAPTDDTPTRATSSTSPTSTGAGCSRTALSSGPITSQVVVVTTSSTSAAGGSTLPVKTEIVVLSDGPRVVARPQWSALEVLGPGAVVARSVGSAGPDVPTPLTRGTTLPAQTVPTQITLTGCDGQPLPAGAYRLRALVGYGSDALNNAAGGSPGAFVMASEPVDLTIT